MPTKTEKKKEGSKVRNIGKIDLKDLKNLFKKADTIGTNKNVKNKKEKSQKAKNVVAMDIGTNFIKMAEGKYSKGNLKINSLMQIPTPKGAIADGKILDKDVLKEIIKYAFSGYGIRAKDGVFTTNSSTIINREIEIPKVSQEEMDTVIRYEIQQYLPINLDDYVIEYIVLDEIEGEVGTKVKLNVITYPERTAYGYFELLDSLELNPYALDVTYNSLRKIASHSGLITKEGEELGGTVAFVDMGATSVNVNIFRNSKVDFTRIIKFGGNTINNALSEKLNISIKATESTKREKANLIDISEVDEINMTVKDSIDDFLDELQRVLQFYVNRSSGVQIDKVIIYGGTSNIKGLDSYMKEKLKLNIEKIYSLDNVEFNTRKIIDEPIGEYLNVIGSIIRL